MKDAIEGHEGTVSMEAEQSPVRFADDIDNLAGEGEELAKLVERLDKASTASAIEISGQKAEMMTSNTSNINEEIKVNGQELETVTSFKYLGSVVFDEGSKPERDTLQDSTENSNIDKADTSLELQEHFSQDTIDALPCHIHLPVCLRIMDPHSRATKKDASDGNEVLPQDTMHLMQRSCQQQGSLCQDLVLSLIHI